MTKRIAICMIGITALLLCGCSQTDVTDDKDTFAEMHMLPAETTLYDELCSKMWMTSENVQLRKVSYNTKEEQVIAGELSYTMVNILAVVNSTYGDGWEYEPWALVSYESQETMLDTVGWVRVAELMEYTEETKHLLQSPVSLPEGTVDAETGAVVKVCAGLAIVGSEDDYVTLLSAGGNVNKVHKDEVIYPETDSIQKQIEAEAVMAELLPKFNKIYAAIDCGAMEHGSATITVDDNVYHLIADPDYTSVANIRNLLQQVYTDSYIAEEEYLEGETPWYIDYENQLYRMGKDAVGCPLIGMDKVIRMTEEELIVSVKCETDEGTGLITMYLLKESDAWKINAIDWNP